MKLVEDGFAKQTVCTWQVAFLQISHIKGAILQCILVNTCVPNGQAPFKTATKTSGTSQLVSVLYRLNPPLIWMYDIISSLAFWVSSWSGQSPPPYRRSRSAAHKANSMFSQHLETCLQMGCIMITLHLPTAAQLVLGSTAQSGMP